MNLELAPEDLYDSGSGVAFSHIMTYPGGYTVAQTVVDTILQKLCAFQGTSVVESIKPFSIRKAGIVVCRMT